MLENTNNSYKYITDENYFKDKVKRYLNQPGTTSIYSRIEPDTRDSDEKSRKALSFETFDPLWMLARQWQFGRFHGNDCGTPISVKVRNIRQKIKINNDDTPLEYNVEKINYRISPYVRIESAMLLKKRLLRNKENDLLAEIEKKYKLDLTPDNIEATTISEADKEIEIIKNQKNETLKKFSKFFTKRAFDGYKVYKAILNNEINLTSKQQEILNEYKDWFKEKFLPNEKENESWNSQKLGYETILKEPNISYRTENYASGTLSWYSFDRDGEEKIIPDIIPNSPKFFSYIPTPATFPGAPSRRLWEFENRNVNLVETGKDKKYVIADLIARYVFQYGNDWMITPIETETGTILDIDGIVVKDTFNEVLYIDKDAQDIDNLPDNQRSFERWNLFGSSRFNAYAKEDFSVYKGLFCPPTVIRCEESTPLEEVQFLRDEMANMTWGVETKINNGCGGTMDGQSLSDAVFVQIDLENQEESLKDENTNEVRKAKYSLLIQNRVPLNWIPFLPEQNKGNTQIAFRRGRMPIYYKKNWNQSARPSTKLLSIRKDENGKIKPFYINEEEFGGYGFKVTETAQRTRWFYGKSFNWLGYRKTINEYQANSGLLFDELIRDPNK